MYQIIVVTTLIYIIGFTSHFYLLKKTVYGDGIYYYSWLRSIVVDHDVNFSNEYTFFHVGQKQTQNGLLGNIYPIGPALFWLPNFSWIHSIVRGNGYTMPYQFTVGITGVLYGIVGFILLYRLLIRFFSTTIVKLTIVSIAFATNTLFYGSLDTVNSHALSFFLATTFLLLFFQKTKNFFILGIFVGLIGLIRPQDVVYGFLLIPMINMKSFLKLATGFLIAFSPQFVAWQILYNKFWSNPYLDRGYGFNIFNPKLFEVLFSVNNGLITWTPIILLCFIGLFLLPDYKNLPKYSLLGIVCIQIVIIASWTTWWQGASYSGRMFISVLPIFSIGLAEFYMRLKAYQWTVYQYCFFVIGPLSALNILLIIFFLLKT